MTKQLVLGRPLISAGVPPERNWERLAAILEAMSFPSPAATDNPAGAGVSYFGGSTVDFRLTERLKDTIGDGVYKAIAAVLDADGTQTTVEPTTVEVVDRGGRYADAKVDAVGKAQQRLYDNEVVWEIIEVRETRILYHYGASDGTGGTAITGSAATVTFDTEIFSEGGVWTLGSGVVTVDTTGLLTIEADVTVNCSAITSGNPNVAVYVDVNGAEATGSRRFIHPFSVTGKSSCAITWSHSVSVGDQVSIKAVETAGATATIATVADSSFLRFTILDVDVTPSVDPPPDSGLGNVIEWEGSLYTDNTGINTGVNSTPYTYSAHTGSGAPSNGGSYAGTCTTTTHGATPVGVTAGGTFKWNQADMTVLFWFKTADAANIEVIAHKGTKFSNPDPEWYCYLSGTRQLTLDNNTYDSSNTLIENATVQHATNLTQNQWYMVGLHWQKFEATGNRWRIGVSIDGGAITWSDLADATAPALTGDEVSQTTGEFYFNWNFFNTRGNFQIDMYRQWYRELSTTELTWHYNSGAGRSWPF